MQSTRDPNTSQSAMGGPPGSHGAASINAAAEAIKAGNPPPELAEAIERGYEPHDINLRWIFAFGFALVITLIVVLLLVGGIMKLLLSYDRGLDPVSSPVNVEHTVSVIPLQPSESHDRVDRDDMDIMRAHVQDILNGTGQRGDRRWIPISQAMQQVLPMLPIGPQTGQGNGEANPGVGRANLPTGALASGGVHQ